MRLPFKQSWFDWKFLLTLTAFILAGALVIQNAQRGAQVTSLIDKLGESQSALEVQESRNAELLHQFRDFRAHSESERDKLIHQQKVLLHRIDRVQVVLRKSNGRVTTVLIAPSAEPTKKKKKTGKPKPPPPPTLPPTPIPMPPPPDPDDVPLLCQILPCP